MTIIRSTLLAFAAAFGVASAADYSEFYLFGDSLSDVGNSQNKEPFNLGGRFSNGPVWNEYLAEMLAMPVPTKSDSYQEGDAPSLHATNFARGGAMLHHGPTTMAVPSVYLQICGRISDKAISFRRYGISFADTDLVSLWGGANNLFFSGQTQIRGEFEKAGIRAAEEAVMNARILMAFKAKTVLIFNLPDIGKTPCYAKDAKGAADATTFSRTYNEHLKAYLPVLKAEHPEVNLVYIDMEAIFEKLFAEPEKYGFKDNSSQLIEVLPTQPDADPSTYVFYDDVHPTTAAHKFIAEQIFKQITNYSMSTSSISLSPC